MSMHSPSGHKGTSRKQLAAAALEVLHGDTKRVLITLHVLIKQTIKKFDFTVSEEVVLQWLR